MQTGDIPLRQLSVTGAAYHRNGSGGTGFLVVRFRYRPQGQRRWREMVATIFDASRIAVLDVSATLAGRIDHNTFLPQLSNQWDGQAFVAGLREKERKVEQFFKDNETT